jgi:hypothetical protein
MQKYNLIWNGEVIESDLDLKEATYLRAEYNMAFNGGVSMVEILD